MLFLHQHRLFNSHLKRSEYQRYFFAGHFGDSCIDPCVLSITAHNPAFRKSILEAVMLFSRATTQAFPLVFYHDCHPGRLEYRHAQLWSIMLFLHQHRRFYGVSTMIVTQGYSSINVHWHSSGRLRYSCMILSCINRDGSIVTYGDQHYFFRWSFK